eukprot:gnl/TRDRNA2_/TRDRNA2_88593_c2_seq2.p1 gnl/TRDRNA2_/TRDRNA2_88593_c2~~gnl/TRDRNA2_/TRDRNA2_88593_c2_seq2.p1  ORF type:complete len:131 (+),score=10.32 gnl/TRDRNA2_/TRDRNA2_88593_c2_seq2:25-417(+)
MSFVDSLNDPESTWHETDLHSELSIVTIRALRRVKVVDDDDGDEAGGFVRRMVSSTAGNLPLVRRMVSVARQVRESYEERSSSSRVSGRDRSSSSRESAARESSRVVGTQGPQLNPVSGDRESSASRPSR